MAGAAGFEPAVHGIKTRCLTTWLRPNTLHVRRNCAGLVEENPVIDDEPHSGIAVLGRKHLGHELTATFVIA